MMTNQDKHTFFMKKNLIAGPICLKIVGPVMGFFLPAKNKVKMADRLKGAPGKTTNKLQNTPNPKKVPM